MQSNCKVRVWTPLRGAFYCSTCWLDPSSVTRECRSTPLTRRIAYLHIDVHANRSLAVNHICHVVIFDLTWRSLCCESSAPIAAHQISSSHNGLFKRFDWPHDNFGLTGYSPLRDWGPHQPSKLRLSSTFISVVRSTLLIPPLPTFNVVIPAVQ